MRMSRDRLPKQTLFSQLSSGHRKSGRSRLRFKDTLKRNLKLIDIKISSLDHRKKCQHKGDLFLIATKPFEQITTFVLKINL